MENYLWHIFTFLLCFLIIFVLLYFIYLRQIKRKKKREIIELVYLQNKFHLDSKKLNARKQILWISMIDAFIMSFVWTFMNFIPVDFGWQLMIAFVLVFALIYSMYEIYGRHLVKKGYQKKEGRKE
ncbi:MAG: hypothetical protein IJ772_00720 [Bacilli bacterium]|nr:hypothetical protein [Bacilli bacterium]MBR1817350.1 hypothetical protein [Bacilli bacterium]